MPALTTYTQPLTPAQAASLRAILEEEGWAFESKPWCLFAASRGKVNVLVYEKGPKVVVQGKDTESFVLNTLEPRVLGVAELGYEEVHHPEHFEPHLGGVYLTAAGRRRFVEAWDERLRRTVKHRGLGRHVSYERLIRLDAYRLVRHLTDAGDPYRGFRAWW